ncbi:MAG: glycosyltransferase family 4 protein [Rhizobiaceae bacterium]
MTTSQTLAFVLPNVFGGGAAKVAAILCGEWVDAGHRVHLITYEDPGQVPVYPLDSRIIRHQIGLGVSPRNLLGFVGNNVRRVSRLRRTLRRIQPDAVVAFLPEANMAAVFAGLGLGFPVLISERNHPEHHKASRINAFLRRRLYPLATRLCVQTQDIRDWFRTNLGQEASVIPNPVRMPDQGVAVAHRPQGRRQAISLGRLDPQKGFDRLIDAFAAIVADVPEWDIVIYGEGSERANLEAQIERLGLAGRIALPGSTQATFEALQASELYLHPARYEGFPNAVLEALSTGLCVVATDCPGATGEILQHGKHGMLVPAEDTQSLADAMRYAMNDQALRSAYSAKAREAVNAYASASIAALWLDEIEGCKKCR